MCVKAWKLHHSNNQMCKAIWIPKAWQAAVFVLRFFKHFIGLQAIKRWGGKYYSSGDGERPWACKEWEVPSPTPTWALRPPTLPAHCEQWHRGENMLQSRFSLPRKNDQWPGYTSAHQEVWGGPQKRPKDSGKWCQPGTPKNPPSAKQGLPPPLWWEAFNSDSFSTWCKGTPACILLHTF